MALDTFSTVWRQVLLRCPAVSPLLAQNMVNNAFRRIAEKRKWSWLQQYGQFIMPAAINTGTIAATQFSPTITGAGTAWVANPSMVGLQFRVSLNYPIYTITAVNVGAQTLTLDQSWGPQSVSGVGYQIYQAYVTVPTDFHSFISVIDPAFNWQLWTNIQQRELNAYDAQRANQGTAYVVAAFDYNNAIAALTGAVPLPRYEIWPHQLSPKVYPFLYEQRATDLTDANATLPRYIRGDVLLEGAMAEVAKWPGPSAETKNPYFDPRLASLLDQRFEMMVMELERQDDETYLQSVWYDYNNMPYAPLPWADSKFLQSHAFYLG